MKFAKLHLLFICFILAVNSAFGSPTVKEVLDTATVKQQLDFVLNKSTTYEDYKVIKIAWVNKLKSNVLDSLKESKNSLILTKNIVLDKQNAIDSLSSSLAQTKSELSNLTKEKNSVRLLGILISKASYNAIMTGIISILLILLGTFLYLFRRSNSITNQTNKDLAEIKEEFDLHRKNSREREEKMARRHLDEILKYKNQKNSNKFTVK